MTYAEMKFTKFTSCPLLRHFSYNNTNKTLKQI